MIDPAELRQELIERDCVYLDTGFQFVGTGGMHLDGYCNLDPLLIDTKRVSELAPYIVEPFMRAGVEAILVPAVGEISLGPLLALQMMEMTEGAGNIKSVWADKAGRNFVIERAHHQQAIANKRVLIGIDFNNQMTTAIKLIRLARSLNAEVVGVAAIAANIGVTAEAMDVSIAHALTSVEYRAWELEACGEDGPCAEERPIVVDDCLGHGADYRAKNLEYKGGYVKLLNNGIRGAAQRVA